MLRLVCLLTLWASPLVAAKPLQIFFIDVEGGQATLLVSPSGQSLLIDTGWPGNGARDAQRIAAAAKQAHIKQIDYVLITHFHADHVGGVAQLRNAIPVGQFLDHGPLREPTPPLQSLYDAYLKAVPAAERRSLKPGDTIPFKDLEVTVLTADGEVLPTAAGAMRPNPLCSAADRRPDDTTENPRSVGLLVRFGAFRLLDLGDLTWNKELDLVCPSTSLAPIDLFVVTHHGSDQSNPPALVHSLGTRVAVIDNGAKKGGALATYQTLKAAPGPPDIWQLHFAVAGGQEGNAADPFVANLEENSPGNPIVVTAQTDGSFEVRNARNNFRRAYPAR